MHEHKNLHRLCILHLHDAFPKIGKVSVNIEHSPPFRYAATFFAFALESHEALCEFVGCAEVPVNVHTKRQREDLQRASRLIVFQAEKLEALSSS